MKSLKERQKQREHFAKVNAGEVVDPVVTHGTDDNGNVIGDDGKPVEGTAAKGFKVGEDTATNSEGTSPVNGGNDGGGTGNGSGGDTFDYKQLGTHDALNGEKGLAGREKPTGWDEMKVAEKQEWLDKNRPASGNGW